MSVNFNTHFEFLKRSGEVLENLEALCELAAQQESARDDLGFYATVQQIRILAAAKLTELSTGGIPQRLLANTERFQRVQLQVQSTIDHAEEKIALDINTLAELDKQVDTAQDLPTLQQIFDKIRRLNVRQKLDYLGGKEDLQQISDALLFKCATRTVALYVEDINQYSHNRGEQEHASEQNRHVEQPLTTTTTTTTTTQTHSLSELLSRSLNPWNRNAPQGEEGARQEATRRIFKLLADPHARLLDLKNLGLSELPSGLFQILSLTHPLLEELDFSGNSLQFISSEVGSLTTLTCLNLHANELVALPIEIAFLPNLRVLDVTDNPLLEESALETLQSHMRNSCEIRSDPSYTIIPDDQLPSILIRRRENTSIRDSDYDNFWNQREIYNAKLKSYELDRDLSMAEDNIWNFVENRQSGRYPRLHVHKPACLNLCGHKAGPLLFFRLFQTSAFVQRLKNLGLRGNYLATLPTQIGLLTTLQTLSISESLTSLPTQIGSLTQLQRLSIYENYRLTALPTQIGLLTALQDLDLHQNALSTPLPTEIGYLTRLTSFNFSNNGSMFSPMFPLPTQIGLLSALTALNLTDNCLPILPTEMGQLLALTDLDISGNELTILPTEMGRLSALTKLDVSSNTVFLTSLPSEMGRLPTLRTLNLSYNLALNALPTEILDLPGSCTIDLTECGLSTTILERLRELTSAEGYQGPTIHHSMPEERVNDDLPIEERLDELFSIAGTQNSFLGALKQEFRKDPDFQQNLHSWLGRLAWVADFNKGTQSRIQLCQKIVRYLELATKDEKFLEVLKIILIDSAKTCGDRVALSIIHIGIQYRIATCDKGDLSQLYHLITRGLFAMGILEDVARHKVRSLRFVDELEVYLAFPIHLRERLQLQDVIDVEDMLYFACSAVTEQDLDAAEELVNDLLNNQDSVHERLIENDIWIQALKASDPQGFEAIETAVGALMDEEKWGEAEKMQKSMRLEWSKKTLLWRSAAHLLKMKYWLLLAQMAKYGQG